MKTLATASGVDVVSVCEAGAKSANAALHSKLLVLACQLWPCGVTSVSGKHFCPLKVHILDPRSAGEQLSFAAAHLPSQHVYVRSNLARCLYQVMPKFILKLSLIHTN